VSCATTRVDPTQEPKRTEVRLDSNVELKAGQSAAVTGESFTLTFERVASDSRCPVGVQCVWAGDAVVRLAVTGPKGEPGTVELHTQQLAREATFQGFKIRLVQLLPAPSASDKIPADRYVATLVVSRSK
jgi:hypothetical protein